MLARGTAHGLSNLETAFAMLRLSQWPPAGVSSKCQRDGVTKWCPLYEREKDEHVDGTNHHEVFHLKILLASAEKSVRPENSAAA